MGSPSTRGWASVRRISPSPQLFWTRRIDIYKITCHLSLLLLCVLDKFNSAGRVMKVIQKVFSFWSSIKQNERSEAPKERVTRRRWHHFLGYLEVQGAVEISILNVLSILCGVSLVLKLLFPSTLFHVLPFAGYFFFNSFIEA